MEMNRKFKALGLALVAVFAMSVLLTSGAQADEGKTGEFTATEYPADIAVTPYMGPYEFTAGGYGITCNKTELKGTLGAKSKELTITPKLEDCEAHKSGSGSIKVTVKMNGCHFIFTTGTKTKDDDVHGTVHLVCHPDKRIEMEAGTCTVTVTPSHETITGPPHQLKSKHPLKGTVVYRNFAAHAETKQHYIFMDATLEGITYEVHKGVGCPIGENTVKKADGIYHFESRIKGYEEVLPPQEIGVDVG